MDIKKVVVNNDIPFHCIKVTPEKQGRRRSADHGGGRRRGGRADWLGRGYMQILSDEMLPKDVGRIIISTTRSCPVFKGAL